MRGAFKQIIGDLLYRMPRLQEYALKLSVYPRFRRWCREYPCEIVPGTGREARGHLYQLVSQRFDLDSSPIHYWEFGVYCGWSIQWWVCHNKHPESRFVGFDSFVGLPEDWGSSRRAGDFSTAGVTPDVQDARCTFQVGWFHQTLPAVLGQLGQQQRTIIHMDADLYRSTIFVLLQIGPHLKPGDLIIFDEFEDSAHEYRAFEDYVAILGASYEVVGATAGCQQTAVVLS